MDNYIKRFHDTEKWAIIEMSELFSEKFTLEISNYGIVKRTQKSDGTERILNELHKEGYLFARITVMEKISEKDKQIFNEIRLEISKLKTEIKEFKIQLESLDLDSISKSQIQETSNQKQLELDKTQKSYKRKYKKNTNSRKKIFGNLIHRFVANYFLEQPSENHNLVAHIDYDKHNNHHSNLKWMTREENVIHQKNSPYVVKSKIKALSARRVTRSKLTTSQVSILKKRMNEGISLRELAKRYPITETQLLRIKRGENWAKVPAAR